MFLNVHSLVYCLQRVSLLSSCIIKLVLSWRYLSSLQTGIDRDTINKSKQFEVPRDPRKDPRKPYERWTIAIYIIPTDVNFSSAYFTDCYNDT